MRNLEKSVSRFIAVFLFVGVVSAFVSSAQAQPAINLSGYEIFLGVDCTIATQDATCGVTFTGWTGGDGPVPDGWQRFPGDRQGLWSANVNYAGKAGFGNSVQLLGGRFRLALRNGTIFSGFVTGGAVQWPATAGDSLGCGNGIATMLVNLAFAGGGAGLFQGCLHDLPVGSAIPPKVWGTLSPAP